MSPIKRIFLILLGVTMLLAGCRESSEIHVITREIGSGTRKTFEDSLGVTVRQDAQVSDSTGVVLSCVASDKNAIGYVSGAVLSPSVRKVEAGEMLREMYLVTWGEPKGAAKDFMAYIHSQQGQQAVKENRYVPIENRDYDAAQAAGKITVAGSSAVAPLLEKLAESYSEINTDVKVEIQQSDSSTGLSSLAQGICDIAMSSRDLTEKELSDGLIPDIIAYDELCVIINPKCPVSSLTSEQVADIFAGKIVDWSELS